MVKGKKVELLRPPVRVRRQTGLGDDTWSLPNQGTPQTAPAWASTDVKAVTQNIVRFRSLMQVAGGGTDIIGALAALSSASKYLTR